MSLEDYLQFLNDHLSSIELISFFLTDFHEIKRDEDFLADIRARVFEVTNTPEIILFRGSEKKIPDHHNYSFVFREDKRSSGVFDLDFINQSLFSFRGQLFYRGSFANWHLDKRYQVILKRFLDQYGNGYRKQRQGHIWFDNRRCLSFTLQRNHLKVNPSISFAIVDTS